MSNQDKYYVPDESEIRTGQTVEVLSSSGWERFEVDLITLRATAVMLAAGALRIKRLDASDIEAEGWEDMEGGYIIERKDGACWRLEIMPWRPIKIWVEKNLDTSTLFYGTIRNRFELRELMRMIGIKKESK